MTAPEFTDSVLRLLRQRPFVPFEVELTSGERFVVHRPGTVACDGGGAAFIDDEGELHFFDYTDTKRLEVVPPQTASA
jgi:hypothetical protein